MQVSCKRESQLSIVEPTDDRSAESAQKPQASPGSQRGARRRRLTSAEEREIARLYGETHTPTAQIRERFGIGDSSLYRVVQRRGLALRGRTAISTSRSPKVPRAQSPDPRAELRPSQPVAGGSRRSRLGRPSATQAPATPAEYAPSQTARAARHRYLIRFEGERVFQARDIQDALRQAQSSGASEVVAVEQVD